MHEQETSQRFERLVLPHLDAAYNLARWLTKRDHDAQDVVQEAFLRAYKAFADFRGDDARCWLLTIVRNACFTHLEKRRSHGGPATSLDEDLHDTGSYDANPEVLLNRQGDRELVRQSIERLQPEYREVIVLREIEGLSYQEIASVANVPIGTVMSRLNRGRQRLQMILSANIAAGDASAAQAKGGVA